MPSTPLAEVAAALARGLDWYQIFEGPTGRRSHRGLMAAQIVGRGDRSSATSFYFGMFLLAPQVTYPLHQHAALEIYHVLSGRFTSVTGARKLSRHIGGRAFDHPAPPGP